MTDQLEPIRKVVHVPIGHERAFEQLSRRQLRNNAAADLCITRFERHDSGKPFVLVLRREKGRHIHAVSRRQPVQLFLA